MYSFKYNQEKYVSLVLWYIIYCANVWQFWSMLKRTKIVNYNLLSDFEGYLLKSFRLYSENFTSVTNKTQAGLIFQHVHFLSAPK